MRRFFISKNRINGSVVFLTDSEARHLITVLRIKSGEIVELFDGEGTEYEGRVTHAFSGQVEISISRILNKKKESPVEIILAQAMLKSKKMDTLVRQITELGINMFLPFFAKRSVVSLTHDQVVKRTERWEKIVIESLKQCKRNILPKIEYPVSFEESISYGHNCGLPIIFWEKESKPLSTQLFLKGNRSYDKIFAMFGPEGGFTKEEVKKAKAAGFICASLGPRILRAETAAMAGSVLLQHLFGDMG